MDIIAARPNTISTIGICWPTSGMDHSPFSVEHSHADLRSWIVHDRTLYRLALQIPKFRSQYSDICSCLHMRKKL